MSAKPLKLRARDADDLAVLSTVLQDSVVPVRDMLFEPKRRRFLFIANRFRWEGRPEEAEGASHERIHSAVRIDTVHAVWTRGIDRRKTDSFLSLLAIRPSDDTIELDFAGGATAKLAVDRIDARIEDIGESWPTQWRPSHDLDSNGEQAGTGG